MSTKRKQSTPANQTPRKRAKGLQSSPPTLIEHAHGAVEPDKFYRLRSIIGESSTKYQIDWEDDPKTGEKFEPTWEPKGNVTKQAIKEWNLRKAREARQKNAAQAPKAAPARPSTPPAKASRGRPRRVVDSSPEISSKVQRKRPNQEVPQAAPTSNPSDSAEGLAPELEIVESQRTEPGDEAITNSPLFEPVVELSDPPSSYLAGAYQKYSSSVQGTSGTDNAQPAISSAPATSEEQSRSVPVNFGEASSRVIPDSQTNIDLTSSAPAAVSSSRSGARDASAEPVEAIVATPAAVPSSSAPALTQDSRSSPVPNQVSETPAKQLLAELAEHSQSQENRVAARESIVQAFPSGFQQISESTADTQVAPLDNVAEPYGLRERGIARGGAESVVGEALLGANAQVPAADRPVEPYEGTKTNSIDEQAEAAPSTDVPVTGTEPSLSTDRTHSQLGTSPEIFVSGEHASDSQDKQISQTFKGNEAPEEQSQPPTERAESYSTEANSRSEIRVTEEPITEQAPTPSQHPSDNSVTATASSFPFQTQIPRFAGSGIAHTASRTGSPIRRFSKQPGLSGEVPAGSSPRHSSPIASIPSYSVDTIGESAPPRPATLSSPQTPAGSTKAMENSQTPGDAKPLSFAEKLAKRRGEHKASRRAMREASIASSTQDSRPPTSQAPAAAAPLSQAPQAPKLVSSLIAEEQSRRSPSAVPAVEPPEVVTQEEMNTSERYGTLLPQAEKNGTQQGSLSGPGPTLSRQPSKVQAPEMSNNHLLPIAFLGHQRDQYSSVVERDMKVVERFLASSTPDVQLTRDAERFLEQKRQVAMHPDLVNGETMTPYDVRPEQEAQWYIDCSAKFRFLKELFDGVRDQSLHIAIVAQPGRIPQMLDTLLSGITVPHRRMHDVARTSIASEDQGLMVTVVSADEEMNEEPSPADLVIALDPTISAECAAVRAFTRTETATTLTTLVVPYTIEHLEQSISTALPDNTRLRTLVTGFSHYRNEAGKLEDGQLGLRQAAQALAGYLAQDGSREWPLATLAPLENLDSQTESNIEAPATQDQDIMDGIAGSKRPLDVDDMMIDANKTMKKARIELPTTAGTQDLPTTINPQDLDITHVSDSVTEPTQGVLSDPPNASGFVLSGAEQRLQQVLEETQVRLEQHVQSLDQVQYQYEELRQQMVLVTRSRDLYIAQAQAYKERAAKADERLTVTRAELTETKQQLADAKSRLADHSVPERAEVEKYRVRAELAESEKISVETRLERLTKEHEYLRDTYQTESRDAQVQASQVTNLENSLALAQNKASSEQSKLRQMGYDAQTKSLQNESKKLKAMLRDRDVAMKFRDEEIARLKEASRGRMGTRGTSVPRSPRLGSPMKMADGHARGMGSRQGSPAAGDLRTKGMPHLHPLRNG